MSRIEKNTGMCLSMLACESRVSEPHYSSWLPLMTAETQRFILVQGAVRANPYFSGAAALVFICSIIGLLLLATCRWSRWNMDLVPKVPTLLYIGRRGRVTKRAIELPYCFLVCYTICATD